MINKSAALAVLAAIAASAPARAAVTISTAATQNMNCSGGTCAPAASKAVLNASDLENYLSLFGNVRVTTTGSGIEANNIEVRVALTSPQSTSLTLEAHKTITVNAAVSVGSGTAELELQSDTQDALHTLYFGKKGHITFDNLSDIFGINGGIYTLVGSVQGLANAVAANPSGAYAFANDYDASQDGTYSVSPVSTTFTGAFEALGNSISNLTIDDATDVLVGLFAEIGTSGTIRNVVLRDVRCSSSAAVNPNVIAGGVVGQSYGAISNVSVSGSITTSADAEFPAAGGITGVNSGTISDSSSSARVVSRSLYYTGMALGGLTGYNQGTVKRSSATGTVEFKNYSNGNQYGGGMVGYNEGLVSQSLSTASVICVKCRVGEIGSLVGGQYRGTIENSYATGAVTFDRKASGDAGGLVGQNDLYSVIVSSYSMGAATGSGELGGLIGWDVAQNNTDAYWDTDTSGITNLSQGAGSPPNDPGITGLSTAQLQSGLPTGLDPSIWAEDPNINNGLPYLIKNPPPK